MEEEGNRIARTSEWQRGRIGLELPPWSRRGVSISTGAKEEGPGTVQIGRTLGMFPGKLNRLIFKDRQLCSQGDFQRCDAILASDRRLPIIVDRFHKLLDLDLDRTDELAVEMRPVTCIRQFETFSVAGIQVHGRHVHLKNTVAPDDMHPDIAKATPTGGPLPAVPRLRQSPTAFGGRHRPILKLDGDPGIVVNAQLIPDPAAQAAGRYGRSADGVIPNELVDVVNSQIKDRANPTAEAASLQDGRVAPRVCR